MTDFPYTAEPGNVTMRGQKWYVVATNLAVVWVNMQIKTDRYRDEEEARRAAEAATQRNFHRGITYHVYEATETVEVLRKIN